MLGIPSSLRMVLSACLGFALLQGAEAHAASFEINPVRVSLSSATSSSLIAVSNRSHEPVRFQVTAFTWAQGPTGEMQLDPTDELVTFPSMFTIKAGEVRNVRVGTIVPAGTVEKTYRILVNELPSLADTATSNAIRVLTRMAIPVFVSPDAAKPAPAIDGLSVQQGELAFTLRNLGTAFFMARHVRVSAVAWDSTTILSRQLPAWYVLAGGLRAYTLPLSDGACSAARLDVDVETETATVHTSIDLPQNACAH